MLSGIVLAVSSPSVSAMMIFDFVSLCFNIFIDVAMLLIKAVLSPTIPISKLWMILFYTFLS